ncbi:hypothetical protein SAMN04488029_2346 [Reichenbachiella faecimaris]|uniref:Uncharacterized protein n=1 Tax=Reichenbachiella faecimaris TaxID=692418 RepID=A0A1W2GEK7_REIFA|nr:hypothetical protein [Reichenbachiella faecimaris]SMD35109.1 hypothetical protein SAMN04488029_2346 [Reichenbachiella faecimaris]
MESTKYKPSYILYLLMYVISLFILFKIEILNWYFIISVTIIWLVFFYKEEFYIHKIEKLRKEKIYTLLCEKYNGGKETPSGNFEVIYFGEAVLFSYGCISTRGGIRNDLKIFCEITDLDERLKTLCKIHFYYEKLEERDWIHVPFSFSWRNSIQYLAKNSDKRIIEIRTELVKYINEKSSATSREDNN